MKHWVILNMYKERKNGCVDLFYCGQCLSVLMEVLNLVGGLFGVITGVLILTWRWIPGIQGASRLLMSSKYTAVLLLFVRDYRLFAGVIGVVEIVFGLFCIVSALVSIVGRLKDSKRLLTASAVLKTIIAILLWVSAIAVVISQSAITSGVRSTLKSGLQTNYLASARSENSISATFSVIQTEFHCCGVDGWTDYHGFQSNGGGAVKALKAIRLEERDVKRLEAVLPTTAVQTSQAKRSAKGKGKVKVLRPAEGATVVKSVGPVHFVRRMPLTCCKGTGSYRSFQALDKRCTTKPTDTNSYWKTGCLDKIRASFTPYYIFMVVSFIGLLLMSVISVSFSWVSVARAGRSEYEIK
ncbi:uncharacterized protein LOC135498981 [Lineus longissimus]|uniref:uncharacterized protein LOC135498981 n=1 Tax=Lineus longissimus TaxID=88925 RepID=UPI00315C4FE7